MAEHADETTVPGDPDARVVGAALRLAARSGKSTGNVLNVDGGVPAAYPR